MSISILFLLPRFCPEIQIRLKQNEEQNTEKEQCHMMSLEESLSRDRECEFLWSRWVRAKFCLPSVNKWRQSQAGW